MVRITPRSAASLHSSVVRSSLLSGHSIELALAWTRQDVSQLEHVAADPSILQESAFLWRPDLVEHILSSLLAFEQPFGAICTELLLSVSRLPQTGVLQTLKQQAHLF